jgi:hypothetical protein
MDWPVPWLGGRAGTCEDGAGCGENRVGGTAFDQAAPAQNSELSAQRAWHSEVVGDRH